MWEGPTPVGEGRYELYGGPTITEGLDFGDESTERSWGLKTLNLSGIPSSTRTVGEKKGSTVIVRDRGREVYRLSGFILWES